MEMVLGCIINMEMVVTNELIKIEKVFIAGKKSDGHGWLLVIAVVQKKTASWSISPHNFVTICSSGKLGRLDGEKPFRDWGWRILLEEQCTRAWVKEVFHKTESQDHTNDKCEKQQKSKRNKPNQLKEWVGWLISRAQGCLGTSGYPCSWCPLLSLVSMFQEKAGLQITHLM